MTAGSSWLAEKHNKETYYNTITSRDKVEIDRLLPQQPNASLMHP
jgi:hypothetical protein